MLWTRFSSRRPASNGNLTSTAALQKTVSSFVNGYSFETQSSHGICTTNCWRTTVLQGCGTKLRRGCCGNNNANGCCRPKFKLGSYAVVLQKTLSGNSPQIHGSTTNTVLQVSHIVHTSFDLLEIAEALPHVLHAVGPAMGYIAMPLTVVSGLMELGEANEAGDRDAERNAYRSGFACQLVYGYIRNALPSNTVIGQRQLFGEKVARRLLDSLKADVRAKFLAVYRGPEQYPGQNLDRALHDVGAH
jgi:hypothetical protein